MRLIITLLFAAWAGCGFGAVTIKDTEAAGKPAKTLSNRILSFTVIPSSNGRITSLRLPSGGNELLIEYIEKTNQEDPLLPPMTSSNSGGYKEWFFGRKEKNISNFGMIVEKQEVTDGKAMLTLYSPNYMGSPFSMVKTYTLRDGASKIGIEIKLKNTGNKPETAALWINNMPNTGIEEDYNIIPVAGNSPFAGRYSTINGSKDEVRYLPCKESHNEFFAAGQPWFAHCFKKLNTALVITADDPHDIRPGGMFYTWQGIIEAQRIVTQEVILAPVQLAPQQEKSYNLSILILRDMPKISAMAGNIAVHAGKAAEAGTTGTVLTFSAVSDVPAQTLKIRDGNRERQAAIPAIPAGGKIKITIPETDLSRIKFYLGGRAFTLPPDYSAKTTAN